MAEMLVTLVATGSRVVITGDYGAELAADLSRKLKLTAHVTTRRVEPGRPPAKV
ncbi:MAG: hypothetical protein ACR2HN_00635 [Tepidiformaceae bacterium]